MHLAVYFPGGSIPGQDPFDYRLAWVTLRSLEQAGALAVPVHYDDDVLTGNVRAADCLYRGVRVS